MEALIKVPSAQFNNELFEKIRFLLNNEYGLEVTISIRKKESEKPFTLNETEEEYWKRLSDSVKEVEEGNTRVFTMEELDEYLRKNSGT